MIYHAKPIRLVAVAFHGLRTRCFHKGPPISLPGDRHREAMQNIVGSISDGIQQTPSATLSQRQPLF
jgi:hypothetical protein